MLQGAVPVQPHIPGVKAMAVEDIEWCQDYAVGVSSIDKAHQDIFRTARRLALLSADESRHQWVGEQGLKFLKSYVVSHFAEEEAYMRSINYPALAEHALQHSTMREKIIPRLESQMRYEHFSGESIAKFLRIMELWLVRHILVHDVAISRRG